MTVIKIRNWSKKLINLLNSKKKIHLKKKNKSSSVLKTKKNEMIYLALSSRLHLISLFCQFNQKYVGIIKITSHSQ
jgi:hypothetical protein